MHELIHNFARWIPVNDFLIRLSFTERQEKGACRKKSTKSSTPGQLCDWACLCWLCWLSVRVGRRRIILIPAREATRAFSALRGARWIGPQDPRCGENAMPRRTAFYRVGYEAMSVKWDRVHADEHNARTWATRCNFASHAIIMVFGLTRIARCNFP